MLKINSSDRMEMKYDSLYSGLVSINKSLGGTQSMPDSEYGAMIDLMETLSGQPVGESGDAFDAVSTVATMAENGELPIQSGGNKIDVGGLKLKFGWSTFTTIPDVFDFSNVIDMSNMFNSCESLTTIPQLDTSKVTNMSSMFGYCISLQSIPLINTSNVTNMKRMFDSCESLTTIPQLDTSKATNMNNMFLGCSLLTTIPQLNTSSATDINGMFKFCTSLTTIPQLDTSNVTNINGIFNNCTALESIPLLDCSNVTRAGEIINPNYYSDQVHLTDMGGFKNIKAWFDIQRAPNLTVQSLMNVINNLYDFIGNGESTTSSVRMGETNLAKLTDEQKAVATNKGWELK